MIKPSSRAGALAAASLAWGCAVGPAPTAWNPPFAARQAELALRREDYETARARLRPLVGSCDAGEYGRRALLMWAAAEVDPGNPSASPRTAALLAEAFLLLPDARPDELVVARTLYRVAADHGGLKEASVGPHVVLPNLASRFEPCAPGEAAITQRRALPPLPPHTSAERASALQADLSGLQADLSSMQADLEIRADSIEVLTARSATQRARIAELESEIERITTLLTSGVARPTSP